MYYKHLPDFIVPGKWQDEKACTDSVAFLFFLPNTFNPWLSESKVTEPEDWEPKDNKG